ncbi:DUF4347 domain-containing protein [Romeria aff. gracilis LEGE 07310]|uniref:DUF4347 domain-containing protein n=1 Tax=Vasconcelosia minhoensis LEGE 07310 TaxID=915328 RepID=A0A8J7ATN3_9CYAN|nr:DUF4347 domain-containing protein [Romeria gracilis]MBE9076353.1 DUF4347 domain-containing protein [Romeria aff. gracilis LEGE 07310]
MQSPHFIPIAAIDLRQTDSSQAASNQPIKRSALPPDGLPDNLSEGTTRQIVFVDPQVDDYPTLVSSIEPDTEVILLDPERDGIVQITEHLQQRSHFSSIHIICNGFPGALNLGSSQLNLATLERYAELLRSWRRASEATNLLLYGCQVAAGRTGARFIKLLHALTGAQIAASARRTGSASLGGDWQLEYTTGQITAEIVFPVPIREAYTSVL